MRSIRNLRISVLLSLSIFAISFLLFTNAIALSVTAISGIPSTSYAGYFGEPVSSGEVTRLHANWNISPVTCQTSLPDNQALLAVIEMRDLVIGNVIQVETQSYCFMGFATPSYSASVGLFGINGGWGETLPIAINAGDNVSASINLNPATNKTIINFTDTTSGQTLIVGKKVSQTYPNTVDLFVQLEARFLPQFSSPIAFSGIVLVDSGTRLTLTQLNPTEYYLVDSSGHVMATTSAFLATGKAFHVTYVRSS